MILADQAHLNNSAATHPGMKGKANEDRYSIIPYHLSSDDNTPSVLAILADGIGGHRAGEVAAQLAVENINKFVASSPSARPAQVLQQALTHTNQLILNFAGANPALVGMGTTCVCAWVIGDRLYAASVGDSRLYLQRGEELTRLTIDHTWIQDALTQGSLTPEQAKTHPNAHIINRFLGSQKAINPDLRLRLQPAESDAQSESNQGFLLLPGDRLMLCTDGLTDLVRDVEILDVVRSSALTTIPTRLIDLANQRGGHDNITILMLEVPRPEPVTQPPRSTPAHIRQPNQPIPAARLARQGDAPPSAASRWMVALLLIAILSMILLLIFMTTNFTLP